MTSQSNTLRASLSYCIIAVIPVKRIRGPGASLTLGHVVFGELAPKSVVIARAEGTALFVAPFMRFFYYLFWPGIVVFNGSANAVVRLFEKRPFAVRMPTLRISVLYE